ncbi:hypothetical protein ScPMuIL_004295 [Solemya velum]
MERHHRFRRVRMASPRLRKLEPQENEQIKASENPQLREEEIRLAKSKETPKTIDVNEFNAKLPPLKTSVGHMKRAHPNQLVDLHHNPPIRKAYNETKESCRKRVRDLCEGDVNTDRLRQELFAIENELYFVNERIHLLADLREDEHSLNVPERQDTVGVRAGIRTAVRVAKTQVARELEQVRSEMKAEEEKEQMATPKRKLPVVHVPRPPSQIRRHKSRAARYKLPKL